MYVIYEQNIINFPMIVLFGIERNRINSVTLCLAATIPMPPDGSAYIQ